MIAPGTGATQLARRAWRIVVSPTVELEAVRREDPSWDNTLLHYTLPLTILPALGWATGIAGQGDVSPFILSFVQTLVLTLSSIVALALGLHLICFAYGLQPLWRRTFAVAALGSTPVLLAGMLFVLPILAIISVLALLHAFYLCYAGAIRLLGCAESEAAGLVAFSCVIAGLVSVGIGAAGSALGLL